MSLLKILISPLVLFIYIVTILNVEDFPAPLAPRSPKISFFLLIFIDIPFTASMFPLYVFLRLIVSKILLLSFCNLDEVYDFSDD